ncbi:acyl-CoA dehydrogenase family protein [Sphingomonas sp. MG17]|jgi:alkylation response protein AidB-like acyl-CoA dehydrogenase|uniref:Acyl-CoA dehydrogenase family protein n=1 Tax=Sphingomonas tagetis TaxID=2949092 RepID=A0A9X2HNJ0_9SPHN|nr:acyl-CoA dehydrogenase family protein [Sphingomonas tagetis]MCP3730608.1 acyl-CoA dehydrogenase family protein [Sphingomonas tagetis]
MISYELTEEQQIVQSTMAEFAREELFPQTRRLDDDAAIDTELLAKLWSTGIVQMQAEAEGRSPVTNAIALEELGAADATLALAIASTLGFVGAIADQGSARQREELLPAFAGDAFQAAAVAVLEPSFGFDVSRLSAKASRDGDNYILNGRKAMVPMASQCSHFLVIAESDGVADALIVPRDTPGVSIAEPKGTLGLRALELAEVTFENVTVPAAMRLGEDKGADVQQIIDGARIALAAIMTGLGRGIRDYVIPYVKDRIVHGTPLAKKQFIAFTIADIHMDVEAMRWMTWKAAWALEERQPVTQQAQLAFTYAGQQIIFIADHGLQMLGGHGFTKGHPVELWYRNARAISVLEGAAGV